MDHLQLQPGEKVILQTSDAWRYQGDDDYEIDDLYLTNRRIICVLEEPKGFFFTKTETHLTQISLADIMVLNGIPQVEQVKDKNHGKTLRIQYKSGSYDLLELCDSPRKNYPIWKEAIVSAVMQVRSSSITNIIPSPKFCAYCGVALPEGANFCTKCGLPVSKTQKDSVSRNSETEIVNEEAKAGSIKEHKSYKLIIKEKKYTLRKTYTIHNMNGSIRYVAIVEGYSNTQKIVVYRQDESIGRIEPTVHYVPLRGVPEYTLYWNGEKYASLRQKYKYKRIYNIPEQDWEFHFGFLSSKVFDKTGSQVMEYWSIISSTNDRYSVEYYDKEHEPAAVLFTLVDVMRMIWKDDD